MFKVIAITIKGEIIILFEKQKKWCSLAPPRDSWTNIETQGLFSQDHLEMCLKVILYIILQ